MVGPGAPFAKYFAGTVEDFRSLITQIVLSLRPCPMNGQDGRLDSESTFSWDSRFVFWQSAQLYSTLMPSFQIKYLWSVINLFKQKGSMNRWEKELKTQGGRSIPERPILKKCCFKIPLQKVNRSNRNERWDPTPRAWLRPGLPVVPLPPPAHPWFSKRRTRDGRNGRTGTKFCRSLITQIVLSLRPCPPFSFPFQLSLWYIQHYITLKK